MAKSFNWNSDGVTLPGKGIKSAAQKMKAATLPKMQKSSATKFPKFNSKATAKNSFGGKSFKI